MTQKVKVSREVADAIDERIRWDKPSEIVRTSVRNGWEERGRCNVGILNSRNTDLDTLIKALYFGYEVEETPEEKWSKRYKLAKEIAMDELLISEEGGQFETEKSIIEEMARDFGLKIEGVDAN